MTILLVSLWLLSGFLSFVYWWTKRFDFTSREILLSICCSMGGPPIFIFIWWVMSEPSDPKVLIKRRK